MSTRPTTARALRESFLSFFEARAHRVIASHSLIPPEDPTLLFVNAGMVQFKDLFTARRLAEYRRATTSQKCLRVSGKHNDLENVGRTPRHHTFFEMLGNFSFGDYFKRDAIRFAWDYLVGVVGLDPSRLHITYFGGEDGVARDDEAASLWREISGLPPERIHALGAKDNFWAMGETGPCGPCSEIHIDLRPGSGPDAFPQDESRYMEIWNLVFMQYERFLDGSMVPLPAPSIDTGMGLERIAAVVAGSSSNYDTDLFKPLIARMAAISGHQYMGAYGDHFEQARIDTAFRVIADHARATAFLISDGVYPANEGRGYVLRRVMRRAIRFGRSTLGVEGPFFHQICAEVIASLGDVYPELVAHRDIIDQLVVQEEERFGRTLADGLKLLHDAIDALGPHGTSVVPGHVVFTLHDTHGFPPDLTALIASERGFSVDEEGYEAAMEEQRARGRASWKGGADEVAELAARLRSEGLRSEFIGYDWDLAHATVLAIVRDGARVSRADEGDEVDVVLDKTPFYAESGGQMGDHGRIDAPTGVGAVIDTQKPLSDLFFHRVHIASGFLTTGGAVEAHVDMAERASIRAHHSATHLLHYALRKVLGEHVRQRGSLVSTGRLRFDFSHFSALTSDEVRKVEEVANGLVLANAASLIEQCTMDEAKARGALMFFGEKYGDIVRVVKLADSVELCGGTHVSATGDVGLVKIVGESAVSAGVRRIEGVCHLAALGFVQEVSDVLGTAATLLNAKAGEVPSRIERLVDERKAARGEIAELKRKVLTASQGDPLANARTFGAARVLAMEVEGVGAKALRDLSDSLRDRLGSGAVCLVSTEAGKVTLLVAVTKDLAGSKLSAGDLVKALAPIVGGRGGGRPDFAQAGGQDPSGAAALVEEFYTRVGALLA